MTADLINEVRSACNTSAPNASCDTRAADYIQDWIEEMSAYVKSVDPNHMLTVGEEGFYPASNPKAKTINPGLSFSTTSGQDFVRNNSPKDIDFAATHIWIGDALSYASCIHILMQCSLHYVCMQMTSY